MKCDSEEEIAEFESPDGRGVKESPGDDLEDDQGRQGKNDITEDFSDPVADGIDLFGKNDPFTFSHDRILVVRIRWNGPPINGRGPESLLLQAGKVGNGKGISTLAKGFLFIPDATEVLQILELRHSGLGEVRVPLGLFEEVFPGVSFQVP